MKKRGVPKSDYSFLLPPKSEFGPKTFTRPLFIHVSGLQKKDDSYDILLVPTQCIRTGLMLISMNFLSFTKVKSIDRKLHDPIQSRA